MTFDSPHVMLPANPWSHPEDLTRDEVRSWFAHARESSRIDVLTTLEAIVPLAQSHQDRWELERFMHHDRSLEAGLLPTLLARLGLSSDRYARSKTASAVVIDEHTQNRDPRLEAAALLRAFNAFYLGDLTLKQLRGQELPPLDPTFTLAAALRAGHLERTGSLAMAVTCDELLAVDPHAPRFLTGASSLPALFAVVHRTMPGISVHDAISASIAAAS